MNNRRNYPLLVISQSLTAFGDNLILALILGPILDQFKQHKITAQGQSFANIYYTSLLFVPYVLLAPFAGYLNDRFAKTRWLTGGNFVKLLGSVLVWVGISEGAGWQSAGYFIVGIGACVYSPAKYGILPEILPLERLVKANGTMELLTLVAILAGGIAGGAIYGKWTLNSGYMLVLAVYGAALFANLLMSRTPSYPHIRFAASIGQFFSNVRDLFSDRRLARILTGTALFWICGAILKMNFQPWGQQVLRLDSMLDIALLGLWLTIGLMAGSVAAGQFYKVGDLHHTRLYGWLLAAGIAALGGIGSLMDFGLHRPLAAAIPTLILTGFVAGLFLIPLNAALQAESHKDKLGKTIATQNGLENLAMLCGSLLAYVNVRVGFNPSQLLVALAIFAALAITWLRFQRK